MNKKSHIVLLVHGIRDHQYYHESVTKLIEESDQSISVKPIKYGFYNALLFLSPFFTRHKPVNYVKRQIQTIQINHPNAKISVIAHSFGCYIIGRILKEEVNIKFNKIIFCGSVLPLKYPWEDYFSKITEGKIINECGTKDVWPVIAKISSWGYGDSGRHGFGSVLVKNRIHKNIAHGDYFTEKFIRTYWVPFFQKDEIKEGSHDSKSDPTPYWLSILGITPLKTILLLIFLCSFYLSFPNKTEIPTDTSSKPKPENKPIKCPEIFDNHTPIECHYGDKK